MSLYPSFCYTFNRFLSAPFSKPSRARLGKITTPHGTIETPAFIFCATKAAIKGVSPLTMNHLKTQIILSNTYHLMLQPGADLIEKAGGLHRFTGWNGPMLTDSGGYQVFSLGHGSVSAEIKGKRQSNRPKTLLKITEEGAHFRSYINGQPILLTPEKSIHIQTQLGADLIVVFDECTPYHVPFSYTQKSMFLSHRWALRSLGEFKRRNQYTQALYGIIQGGVHYELRKASCSFVNENPFFGHAIGGSLGACKKQMEDVIAMTAPLLEESRPIHLLGIGGVRDIFNGVRQGIDTFDCVHPTRLARHGGALIPGLMIDPSAKNREHINLRNAQFSEDFNPIDSQCPCPTCKTFSRAYLHHLLKAQELLSIQAITEHNICFMNRLMEVIRQGIAQGNLDEVEKIWSAPM
jgi:queuine tRNA-ribosyltransferase